MTWYAASLIYVFKLRTGKQKHFSVWEDVCLIEAESDTVARRKAKQLGKARQGDDKMLTVDDQPVRMEFAGVQKLLTIANPPSLSLDADPPTHGTEITFSAFTIKSKKDLDRLIAGQSVSVVHEED